MPLTAAACVSGVCRKGAALGAVGSLARGGRYVLACTDNMQSGLQHISLSPAHRLCLHRQPCPRPRAHVAQSDCGQRTRWAYVRFGFHMKERDLSRFPLADFLAGVTHQHSRTASLYISPSSSCFVPESEPPARLRQSLRHFGVYARVSLFGPATLSLSGVGEKKERLLLLLLLAATHWSVAAGHARAR